MNKIIKVFKETWGIDPVLLKSKDYSIIKLFQYI